MKLGMITVATLSTLLAAGAHAGYTVTGDVIEYFPATNRANQTPGLPTTRINHIFGLGGAAGYRWNEGYGLELDYQVAGKTVIDGGYKWASSTTTSINGYYELGPQFGMTPFVLTGLGRETLHAWKAQQSFSNNLLNLGVGVFYPLVDKLALRAELRGEHSFGSNGTHNDFIALLGVQYRFNDTSGKSTGIVMPEANPEPAPEPEPAPAPVKPTPVPVAPVVLDSDRDGVADAKDNCPGTTGVKVDSKGCPLDSDQDGVTDSADQCPGTPGGAKVDAGGCPVVVTESIKHEINVLFDNNKSDIKAEYKDEIQKVADLARQYPTAYIEIQGYTDNKGSKKLNTELSQRRADAVRDSLVKNFGVDAGRVSSKGYGPVNPVADNATADGRAKNRRVIALLSSEKKAAVASTPAAKVTKQKVKRKARKAKR